MKRILLKLCWKGTVFPCSEKGWTYLTPYLQEKLWLRKQSLVCSKKLNHDIRILGGTHFYTTWTSNPLGFLNDSVIQNSWIPHFHNMKHEILLWLREGIIWTQRSSKYTLERISILTLRVWNFTSALYEARHNLVQFQNKASKS